MAARSGTLWSKTKSGGKAGFDKLYSWVDKLGPPVNRLSNRLGSEAFWPTSLDKECDKAARILKSFCKDGFYVEDDKKDDTSPKEGVPQGTTRVLKHIPSSVIRNAQGIAIFTTMRTGLWISGSGGSGVLIARKEDGTWSSPSGLQVQTMGLGFVFGVDIYDCVLIINTREALEAFTRVRATLGGDLGVTAGPIGAGGLVDTELHKRQAPLFSYLKSRGFYAGLQIEGTVMIERTDENERFYNERISAQDILSGKARHPPLECRGLYETVKAAAGEQDYDASLLPTEAPPSDFEIEHEGHVFGVPDKDDPDPYGVLQLEKEGMVIREAGTHERASWQQFTFSPSVTSPIYDTFDKRSTTSSSRPASYMTATKLRANRLSADTNTFSDSRSTRDTPLSPVSATMSDMGTQTDGLPPPPLPPRGSIRHSSVSSHRKSMDQVPEHEAVPSSPSTHSRPTSYAGTSRSARSKVSTPHTKTSFSDHEVRGDHGEASASEGHDGDAEDTADEYDDAEEVVVVEQPVVHAVQKRPAQPVLQKARMVTVPKRGPPPKLPARNPNRQGNSEGEAANSPLSTASAVSPSLDEGLEELTTSVTTTSPALDRKESEASSLYPDASPAAVLERETAALAAGPDAADAYLDKEFGAASSSASAYTTTSPTPDPAPSRDQDRNPWERVLAHHPSVDQVPQQQQHPIVDLPASAYPLSSPPPGGDPKESAASVVA